MLKIIKAFLLGGTASIITEGIFRFLSFLPVNDYERVLISFVVMGILGGILFIAGIYQRLEYTYGFGAMLPICGLPSAIGSNISIQYDKSPSFCTICRTAILPIAKILLTGFCFSVALGIIIYFVK